MAVVEFQNPSSLKIVLDLGLVDGKAKTRSKSFANLKYDAALQDVYDVGVALMGLQKHDVIDIIKVDNTTLS
ncbi:DUF1659 domain-containing protein [Romboutsia sp. CE17]|uniref:DUF1659 domain-containing protein n=1 Tax=Romboutsia sp. CE17 TaxID=2724150 RepID=UPI001442DEF6|nr:DUF1659 domain-containing protein [Romboutsia sp. CE17]QJA09087.1 DUF1659 domain-containing protein [Romboutsia sp. CE17]